MRRQWASGEWVPVGKILANSGRNKRLARRLRVVRSYDGDSRIQRTLDCKSV